MGLIKSVENLQQINKELKAQITEFNLAFTKLLNLIHSATR